MNEKTNKEVLTTVQVRHEDIKHNMESNTNGCAVLWHGGMLCDTLEQRMLEKHTTGRISIQLVDDLLEKNKQI